MSLLKVTVNIFTAQNVCHTGTARSLSNVSVVGQMKPKVKCNPDNTQTLWPLAWKLHFSSLHEDLLLYWLMVHFCSITTKINVGHMES